MLADRLRLGLGRCGRDEVVLGESAQRDGLDQ